MPFLVECHGGQAGDRLGHRANPEDGIFLHRDAGLPVQVAVAPEVGELAAPGHEHHSPRDLPSLHQTLRQGIDPHESGCRESDVLG